MGEHDGTTPDDGAEDLASVQRKAREIERTEHTGEIGTAPTATDTARPAPATTLRAWPWLLVYEGTPGKSPGVYHLSKDREGNEKPPLWLCDPLHIRAMTRNLKSSDWGRLVEWKDGDGRTHRWAMPMEMLAGDGIDVRRELVRLGLNIAPGKVARDYLNSYLQTWPVKERARCVDRLGWCGPVYVLPDGAIGTDAEIVIFQSASALEPAFSTAGTVDTWRESVARLASGNSRVMFVICCSFAAPLAYLFSEQSGGFHLRSASSDGKSSALAAAASLWGNPAEYIRLWKSTANGLEGLAQLHNDGLLILDEIGQCDPHTVGDAAYMLANEQGKTRATRSGAARAAARWKTIFLSSGEVNLAELMIRAGHVPNVGQEVRLAEINADPGFGHGVFEELHGFSGGAPLTIAIREASAANHGAVGLAWLRLVVADRANVIEEGNALVREFVSDLVSDTAPGQVQRVVRRFGLVAAAGELATGFGLTGWKSGDAFEAAARCFTSWCEAFGAESGVSGNREKRDLLAKVRAFFQVHGSARFEDLDAKGAYPVRDRVGFFRKGPNGEREYLVMPETFAASVCEGHSARDAAPALLAVGWIRPGRDGKSSHLVTIPGLSKSGKIRVYVFTEKVFTEAEGA